MLQTILMSKAFGVVKKYWQVFAGAIAVISTFIVKAIYDKNLKKEVIEEVENVARETMYREQKELDDATQDFLIKNNSNDAIDDDAELERLRKTTSPSASQKAAAKRVLKKLRPKG